MKRRTSKPQPTVYYTPSSLPRRRTLSEMTREEITLWIQGTRVHLQEKKAREKNYIDRRAARGTHTPTDEAYMRDQYLLEDLLWLLDEMEQGVIAWGKP